MSPKLRAHKRKATDDDGTAAAAMIHTPPDASLSLSLSSSGRASQLSSQQMQAAGEGSQPDFAASYFQDSLSASQSQQTNNLAPSAAASAAPAAASSSRATRKSNTAAAAASAADAMEDDPAAAAAATASSPSSSAAAAKKRRTAAASAASLPADDGFAAPWVSQLGCGYNGVTARSTSHRLLIPAAYRASALLSAPANKLPAGWVAASWPTTFHFKLSIHGSSSLRSHTSNSSNIALHLNVPADILSLRAERGGDGSRDAKSDAEADSKVSATLFQVARVYFDPSNSRPLSSLISPSLHRALHDVLSLSSDPLDRSQTLASRRAWDDFFEQHGTEVVVGVRLGHSVYEESSDAATTRSMHTENNATAKNSAGVQLPSGVPLVGGAGVGGEHSKANGSSSDRSSARNRSSSLSHSYGSETHWCDLASDTLELTDPALWPELTAEARRRFEEARASFLERGRAEMSERREQDRTPAEVNAAADVQSSVTIDDGMQSQDFGLPLSPSAAAAAAASSSAASAALASEELLYGFRFVCFPPPASASASSSGSVSSLLSKSSRSSRSPAAHTVADLLPFQCSPDLADAALRILCGSSGSSSGSGSKSAGSASAAASSDVMRVLIRFVNDVNRARARDRAYIGVAASSASAALGSGAADSSFSSSSLSHDPSCKGALSFDQRCALLLSEWQSKLRSSVLSASHWSLIVHFGRSNPCHVHTHKSFVRFECRAQRPDTTKVVTIMLMQHK